MNIYRPSLQRHHINSTTSATKDEIITFRIFSTQAKSSLPVALEVNFINVIWRAPSSTLGKGSEFNASPTLKTANLFSPQTPTTESEGKRMMLKERSNIGPSKE